MRRLNDDRARYDSLQATVVQRGDDVGLHRWGGLNGLALADHEHDERHNSADATEEAPALRLRVVSQQPPTTGGAAKGLRSTEGDTAVSWAWAPGAALPSGLRLAQQGAEA